MSRVHIKQPTQTTAWLLEIGSPATYMAAGDHGRYPTQDPWKAARFQSKELAEIWAKSGYMPEGEWRAEEHVFIKP